MSVAPGTRVGAYEIRSLLGVGGMGEVYRAHDTNLGRDVALKILPESFARDPDRLARFKREAQVLASLNHPNIGAIYGLEEPNGVQALVLELVHGPTLAERLLSVASGFSRTGAGIPLDEALPIARQIAEALEAAHEQGIIHRDLKPANIKLRPDGTVKVLDFGLAKALDPLTRPAGSLSPGRGEGSGFDIPVPTTAAAASTRGWRRERLAWIVAVLLAIAAAVGLVVPYYRTPAAAPEMRLEINTPRTSDPVSFAMSPDGQRLVFVASGDGDQRLWLRPLDAVTAEPLGGTEGAGYPFWSPDNRSVAFFAGGKLKRIDIGGGLPQTLADAPVSFGGTWSADGVILFAPFSGPLFRVPASGGDTAPVTKIDPPRQVSHRFPQFLAGGRRFLFFAQGTTDAQGIYVGSLDSPEITRLMAAETAGAYVPSGWLLFVRQGTLVARRFDLSRGELTGDPVTVADPVAFDGFGVGAFSVSAGLVAYRSGGANQRQLTWFDRTGKALGTLGAPDANSLANPELSPDGRRVAVDRVVQGNTDVWLLDAARTIRFTFDANVDHWPIWSSDGSRIVFDSSRKGVHDLYQKPSSGAGSEELFLESPQNKGAGDWSPDGRFVLHSSNDPNRAFDLWVLPLEGETASRKCF